MSSSKIIDQACPRGGGGVGWGVVWRRICGSKREVTRDWRQFRNYELYAVPFTKYCLSDPVKCNTDRAVKRTGTCALPFGFKT